MLSSLFIISLLFQSAPINELGELSLAKATIHKLRIENAQLQIDKIDLTNQITNLKSQIASRNLTDERNVLEQLFRKELNCKATDIFSWQNLKCEAPVVKKN